MAEGLKVLDVRKSFGTEARPVEVLRGISFGLDPGEEVAITGPSGSGKSTLLHLIGTLDRPTSGRIEIDGREPGTLPEPQLARYRNETIGFVFQDHHLLPQCSVLENVLIPTLAFGGRASSVERARELLERVGLSARIDHRPSELSGGERQRVAVARALVQHPRVLLCDEPTGSLDGASADNVASLIRDLHREQGGILIVVTHNLDLAGRFANRLEIKDGRCSGA